MRKRILITGVNGLLGRVISQNILDNKSEYEIFGTDITLPNQPSDRFFSDNNIESVLLKPDLDFPFYPADVTNKDQLEEIIAKIGNVDVVIHLASIAANFEKYHPGEIRRVNEVGTENIYQLCDKYKIHGVILASSIMTVWDRYKNEIPYSDILNNRFVPSQLPINKILPTEITIVQDDEDERISAYINSKIALEAQARYWQAQGISTICARFGSISSFDRPYQNTSGNCSIWCSHNDLCTFIDCGMRFLLDEGNSASLKTYFVCSNSETQWVDMQDARNDIGFVARDNAEDFFSLKNNELLVKESHMQLEQIREKLDEIGSRYLTIRLRNAESIQVVSEFINNLEFEDDDNLIDSATWQRLGEAATHAGLYDKAKQFYQNALDTVDSIIIANEQHRIVALCNLGLGVIVRECTGASESFSFFIEGLKACDELKKEDSGFLFSDYYEIFTDLKRNYGIALAKNREFDKAAMEFGEALQDSHRCPEFEPLLLPIRSWFGYATALSGEQEKGLERLLDSRACYDQVKEKESSLDYATHCFQMGDTCLRMGNYLSAIRELEISLQIRDKFLEGRNRLRVVDSCLLLAQCHKALMQHEQEKTLLRKIVPLLESYQDYTWVSAEGVKSRLQELDGMKSIYSGKMHLHSQKNEPEDQKNESVSRLEP